jgi:hypothetical protein
MVIRKPTSNEDWAANAQKYSYERIVELLGAPLHDPRVRVLYMGLELKDWLEQVSDDAAEIDLRKEVGVRLLFRRRRSLAKFAGSDDNTFVFSGIIYHSAGDLGAKAFQGRLPHGITFRDSREDVLSKMREPPSEQDFDADGIAGYLRWDWPQLVLHVLYLAMKNRVIRVTVFLPHAMQR